MTRKRGWEEGGKCDLGVIYPKQGKSWVCKGKNGCAGPRFFEKVGGRNKVTKWLGEGRKVGFIR